MEKPKCDFSSKKDWWSIDAIKCWDLILKYETVNKNLLELKFQRIHLKSIECIESNEQKIRDIDFERYDLLEQINDLWKNKLNKMEEQDLDSMWENKKKER